MNLKDLFSIALSCIILMQSALLYTSQEEEDEFDELSRDEIVRFINKKIPEFSRDFQRLLLSDDEEMVEDLLEAGRDAIEDYHELEEDISEEYADGSLKVFVLEFQIDALVDYFHDSEGVKQRALFAQIKQKVAERFDLLLSHERIELASLKKEVTNFERSLRLRTRQRDKLILEEISELVEDDEDESSDEGESDSDEDETESDEDEDQQ